VDLETLLTSRDGFGLESATFMQRARARILDGTPLDDLMARGTEHERRCLEAAIGCPVSQLPKGQPVEVLDIDPVRTGKTLCDAAAMVRLNQTVDVGLVKPGEEPPRTSVLSVQIDTARAFRGHLNIINERPALRALKVGEDADSMTLRHPSGLPIPIQVIAAQRGGYTLASRWSSGVSFQEAPGMYGLDKVISLEDSRDTALGRLLPGAQALYSGSPWQAAGWCFDTFRTHFGRPTTDLVVMRATTVDGVTPAEQLNPFYWTKERIERIRRTSPRTFRMHVLNEFGAATACYDFDAVERAFQGTGLGVARAERPFVVIDPSGGKKDSFTWSVVQRCYPEVPSYAYASQIYIRGDGTVFHEVTSKGRVEKIEGPPPLRPDFTGRIRPFYWMRAIDGAEGRFWDQIPADAVVERIARAAIRAGARRVFTDQHSFFALEPHFRAHGLKLIECPFTTSSKPFAVETFRRWLRQDEIVIDDHQKMRAELHAFAEIPTPHGSFSFRARGGGHDDYAILPLLAVLATTELPAAIRNFSPWEPRI
jgi:hypothetical protein